MDTNLGKRMKRSPLTLVMMLSVSPNFNWFLAFPDEKNHRFVTMVSSIARSMSKAYTIKPGFNYRMGDHTFNITGHFRYIESENYG